MEKNTGSVRVKVFIEMINKMTKRKLKYIN